jgi:hypothetical protein
MPKVMWAPMGKLVPQIPRVIDFAYDRHFRRMIACWKGILEKYTLHCQTLTLSTILLWQAKTKMFRDPKQTWKYIKMC